MTNLILLRWFEVDFEKAAIAGVSTILMMTAMAAQTELLAPAGSKEVA